MFALGYAWFDRLINDVMFDVIVNDLDPLCWLEIFRWSYFGLKGFGRSYLGLIKVVHTSGFSKWIFCILCHDPFDFLRVQI